MAANAPEPVWRPRTVLASILAVIGGTAAIISDLGSDGELAGTMQKAFIVAAVGGALGWAAGWVVSLISRELAARDAPERFRVPDGLRGLEVLRKAEAARREETGVNAGGQASDAGADEKENERSVEHVT